jgi:hypothetical protein
MSAINEEAPTELRHHLRGQPGASPNFSSAFWPGMTFVRLSRRRPRHRRVQEPAPTPRREISMDPDDLQRWFQCHQTLQRPPGMIESGPISKCSSEYNLPDDDYAHDDSSVRPVLVPYIAACLATITIIVLISQLSL